MSREKLIEELARAIAGVNAGKNSNIYEPWIKDAQAALEVIEKHITILDDAEPMVGDLCYYPDDLGYPFIFEENKPWASDGKIIQRNGKPVLVLGGCDEDDR